MTLVSDNWPREEAQLEARHFLEHEKEFSVKDNCDRLNALYRHWQQVFGLDPQGIKDLLAFQDEFNRIMQESFNQFRI